jgi:GAF domain-containing protein
VGKAASVASDVVSGNSNDAEASVDALTEELRAHFVEIQELLSSTDTFSGFLQDLAELAKRSFRDEVHCSITLVSEGRQETAASSDDIATVADETQYGEQAGPCLRALADCVEVRVEDLTTESRFGDYPAKAAALGLRSVVALPLTSNDVALGALNLYAAEPAAFTDGNLVRARMLSAAAAGAVEVARRLTEQLQLNEDLKAAMASRRIIDQALGITMAREGCDADTAFAILRRTSQNEHRKLRDVARDLVTATGGAAPAEAPVFQPPRRR